MLLIAGYTLALVAQAVPLALAKRVDDYLAPYVRAHDFSGVVLIARRDSVLVPLERTTVPTAGSST